MRSAVRKSDLATFRTRSRYSPAFEDSREQLNVLTTRFRKALKKSVEGIIESGRVLIEAKDELEHGQFYRLGSS